MLGFRRLAIGTPWACRVAQQPFLRCTQSVRLASSTPTPDTALKGQRKGSRVPDEVHPDDALKLSGLLGKRVGRRNTRYTLSTRSGRYLQQRALDMLRSRIDVSKLSVPEQLDLARAEAQRSKALKQASRGHKIPRYMSEEFNTKYYFREEDLSEFYTKGRGPGGQATNKRMQTCELNHQPTQIQVRCSKFPSLWANRKMARQLLNLKIEQRYLGKDSRLGEIAERREHRKKLAEKKRRRFEAIAAAKAEVAAEDRDIFGFLCEGKKLPRPAQEELAPALTRLGVVNDGNATTREFKVDCFFNELCQHWWPMMAASGARSSVPQWFGLLFPVGMEGEAPVVTLLEINTTNNSPDQNATDEQPPVATPIVTASEAPQTTEVCFEDAPKEIVASSEGSTPAEREDGVESSTTVLEAPAPEGTLKKKLKKKKKKRVPLEVRKRKQRELAHQQRITMEAQIMAERVQKSMEKCQNSDDVRMCTRRALTCFVEVFGLHLQETRPQPPQGKKPLLAKPAGSSLSRVPPASSPPAVQKAKLSLVQDGVNWLELRGRLIGVVDDANDTQRVEILALRPEARQLWMRVFESLRWLGLDDEYKAIRSFAIQQRKIAKKKQEDAAQKGTTLQQQDLWATQLCRAFASVEGPKAQQ